MRFEFRATSGKRQIAFTYARTLTA